MAGALRGSIVVTLLALLVFGYIKGRFTVKRPFPAPGRRRSSGASPPRPRFVIAKLIA